MEEELQGEIKELEDKLKSLRGLNKIVPIELEKVNEELSVGTKKDGRQYSVRTNRDRFFFPAEWMRFDDALKDSQKLTFDFLINTGARINEARHVKVCDIDFVNKRVILRVTKNKSKER